VSDFASDPHRQREPADGVWRGILAKIPTNFGRLVYVASLLDVAGGKYSESGLVNMLGREGADRTIRHRHHQLFSEWLAFSLADQKADLDEFLRGKGHRPGQRVDWAVALPYRSLIPPAARDVERQLYLADLETLLELLKAEYAAAFSAPEA
jgi:hypothetical protein